jgi:hypothetical protein
VLPVDLSDAVLQPADDLFGVSAAGHKNDATHSFGVAILHHGPIPHFCSQANIGYVADVYRGALVLFQHDVANVVYIAY